MTIGVADLRATLLRRIEGYILLHGITVTEFGRRAVGDGNFVRDFRNGRGFTLRKLERLERFLGGENGDVG